MPQIRHQEFDILKGIGILSIIVGHIWRNEVFYIYHVPLFFFVSGCFFRQKDQLNYFISNVKNLLGKYLICGLITFLLFTIFDSHNSLSYLHNLLLVSNHNGMSVGPIWFLVALFWCRIVFNWSSRFIKPIHLIIVLFFLTCIERLALNYFNGSRIPLSIGAAIPALFFYCLGHIWMNHDNHFFGIKYPLPIAIIIAIGLTFFQIKRPPLGMITGSLSFFPLCLVNAYLYIYILYRLSILICLRTKYIKQFLAFCGANTLNILLFHNIEDRLLIPRTGQILVLFEYPTRYFIFVLIILSNIFAALGYAWVVSKLKNRNLK